MDADWRPVLGSNPLAGVDLNAPDSASGGDWRAQLDPESRSRNVSTISEALKRHLPLSVPEGVNELQKIALRFEQRIYTAATNEHDYMQKISLKMLSMETRRQQSPGNALVMPIQNNPSIHELALVGIQQSAPLMHADPHHGLAAHAGVQPPADVNLYAPAPDAGGDWHTQLDAESRSRIVNQIMEALKRHLPVSVPEGVNELQKIAVRFEEKIYTSATSQPDYMRKISLKMLSMETRTQHAPRNAQVIPNQYNPNEGWLR